MKTADMPKKVDPETIKALILDMDGVLWKSAQPIGDLPKIIGRIEGNNWKVMYATNNATRTVQQYVEFLSSFGVKSEPWQVITSATAVTRYLVEKFPEGGGVYIVGEHGVIADCAEHGYIQSTDGVLAVIVGFDRSVTYEKLKTATLLIRGGAPYIGTNPDLTFPTPEGLIPGAGSILAAVTAATGIHPVVVGKPEPLMYRIALERLGISPQQALVVGDRPETDITCAQLLGCRTALVLSGVTNADQAAAWSPPPDIIAKDLENVVRLIEKHS
jgi:4-nitrophenyl phosphatase